MKINEHTAISTSKIILVPYSSHHVPQYHEWLQDEALQEATASEPLTLAQEYDMQRSWQTDADKLTFIICQPIPQPPPALTSHPTSQPQTPRSIKAQIFDNPETMIGDVNMFLHLSESEALPTLLPESQRSPPLITAEIELMIASHLHQGQNYGTSALLILLHYVLRHQAQIVSDYLSSRATPHHHQQPLDPPPDQQHLSYFSAKINGNNERSLRLFATVGFEKVGGQPNHWGEWEMRLPLDPERALYPGQEGKGEEDDGSERVVEEGKEEEGEEPAVTKAREGALHHRLWRMMERMGLLDVTELEYRRTQGD